MELDLDVLERAGAGRARRRRAISTFPVATQDVALVVDAAVPAADVEAALREGAGELLESSGCSTSSRTRSRSARAGSRWRTRCASARRTAR